MSDSTWKKEFYPVSAARADKGSWETAVKHSIQKWRGFTKAARNRHHIDYVPIQSGWNTCALCIKAKNLQTKSDGQQPICAFCPITKMRGVRCDEPTKHEIWSAYSAGRNLGDTKPMLKLLRATLKFVQKGGMK